MSKEKQKLRAIFNSVIVLPNEFGEGNFEGIIVPDLGKEKNEIGKIISIGPGHHTVTGDFIPTTLKVGMTVVLPTMGFTKLPFNGVEYYVGPENQLLGEIYDEVPISDLLEDTKDNLTASETEEIKENLPYKTQYLSEEFKEEYNKKYKK